MMTQNPFLVIETKLENLESMILDLKEKVIPELGMANGKKRLMILDLNGLLEARPFIGSRSTIYKKVSAGIIPHSKSGKRLIFDLNAIDEWLLSNKIKTAAEIEVETNEYLTRRKRKGANHG